MGGCRRMAGSGGGLPGLTAVSWHIQVPALNRFPGGYVTGMQAPALWRPGEPDGENGRLIERTGNAQIGSPQGWEPAASRSTMPVRTVTR